MKIYDPYIIFFYCNALKLLKRLALMLCICVCVSLSLLLLLDGIKMFNQWEHSTQRSENKKIQTETSKNSLLRSIFCYAFVFSHISFELNCMFTLILYTLNSHICRGLDPILLSFVCFVVRLVCLNRACVCVCVCWRACFHILWEHTKSLKSFAKNRFAFLCAWIREYLWVHFECWFALIELKINWLLSKNKRCLSLLSFQSL